MAAYPIVSHCLATLNHETTLHSGIIVQMHAHALTHTHMRVYTHTDPEEFPKTNTRPPPSIPVWIIAIN